jgi:hypothetical protein
MDHFDAFAKELDSVDADPRTRWKKAARDTILIESTGSDPAIIAPVIAANLKKLGAQLRECLESGRTGEGEAAIRQFHIALRAGIELAHKEAAKTIVTPEREIKKHLDTLRQCAYRGVETEALAALLEPGERIVEVHARDITTSMRVIGRRDLIDVLTPATQTSRGKWEAQFPGEAELRELERDERARLNPGPPWRGNFDRNVRR